MTSKQAAAELRSAEERAGLSALRRLSIRAVLPEILVGMGIGLHAFFAWGHMYGQRSVIDEGLYLFKGWLFATGRFLPFQDFGPYTNHMPLSFLIPGWVQVAFGPGIRTGRWMAYGLGLLMLVGLWVVSRRVGGRWWAILPVWLVALNPFLTKIYAQAISQVLVAAMLVWILVLMLGSERATWQLIAGSALAGAVALTRLNMVPVPALAVAYVYWKHDRRRGTLSLLTAGGVFLLGHIALWPDILKLWAYWIPRGPTPFLDPWREPAGLAYAWDPSIPLRSRWGSFLKGIREHWFGALGALAALATWPRLTRQAKRSGGSQDAIFLFSLLFVLTLAHAWASLANNYCVFCFQMYLAFFSPIGLVLLVLVAHQWLPKLPRTHTLGLLLGAMIVSLMLGTRNVEALAANLTTTQIPRLADMGLVPGTAPLTAPLAAKLGLTKKTAALIVQAGFLLWFLGLLAASGWTIVNLWWRIQGEQFSRWLSPVLAVLLLGWTVPNAIYAGNRFQTYDCGGDVISAMEAAGARLDGAIERGASVYWNGSSSPVPLLYVSDVQIYPPQLNRVYTRRLGGQSDTLYRLGLWNPELDQRWLREADYLLVSEQYRDGDVEQTLAGGVFAGLSSTPPTNPCEPDSAIQIYRRIR